jgi:hypothetical protein
VLRVWAALACLALAPTVARALPSGEFEWIVVAPGDQTRPSIDGALLVYGTKPPGGDWDVLGLDLASGTTAPIAAGPGDQDGPEVARQAVAYRTADGIEIWSLAFGRPVRTGQEPGRASWPVVGDSVAAWELDAGADGLDVAFYRYLPPDRTLDGAFGGPGDQRAPAAYGSWIGYVDDALGGAVRLVDTTEGQRVDYAGGPAAAIAIGGDPGAPRVVVARTRTGGETDLEVYDEPFLVRATLRVRGEQRNPRVAGDWVAFEDLSTGHSQVVLWNLVTGVAFRPAPSASNQSLNDLAAATADSLRVVFADDTHGDQDIALFTLPLPWVDDGQPSNWPPEPPNPQAARCDDPGARVVATLTLSRAVGAPQRGAATVTAPAGTRVLACVDAERVASAWIALGDELLVRPDTLERNVGHLEVRTVVPAEGACAPRGWTEASDGLREGLAPSRCAATAVALAGRIEGTPGATLRVRLLEDPGPAPAAPADGGCGSGGAGAASLLGIATALAARRRR